MKNLKKRAVEVAWRAALTDLPAAPPGMGLLLRTAAVEEVAPGHFTVTLPLGSPAAERLRHDQRALSRLEAGLSVKLGRSAVIEVLEASP